MLKLLPKLHPRERRLALMAVIVLGAWFLISRVIQPLWNRLSDVSRRVGAQQERLDALNRLLVQASSIEQEYQRVASYLVPEDETQMQGAFLNELEALSRASNLQVSFKPRPIKHEARVNQFEVELDLEGPQDQLMAFLDALLRMPKFVTIERLRISSIPTKEQVLRANLVIQKLTITRS